MSLFSAALRLPPAVFLLTVVAAFQSTSAFVPTCSRVAETCGASGKAVLETTRSSAVPFQSHLYSYYGNDDYDEDDWLRPSYTAPPATNERRRRRDPPQQRSQRHTNQREQSHSHTSQRGRRNNRNGNSRSTDRRSPNHSLSHRDQILQAQEASITDTNAHFFSKKSLDDPSLKMADNRWFEPLCEGAGITRPSRIQSLAWPQILSGRHTLVADQTGSGKTLAYLLPLLQRCLTAKENDKGKAYGAPRVLVLAPTAELADQLRAVCDKISQTVPFSTMVITANGKYQTTIRDQIRKLQRTPVDVLISTPGRISTILRTRNSGLDLKTNLQAIVLDEVDILLIDETFGPQLRTVGEAAPALDDTQFVFVTATLPDQIVETVESEFPGVVQVKGPGLHRTAPSLQEHLVDVSVPSEYNRNAELCFDIKAKQLLQALRQNRCRRTLIFCNTVDSCREVENLLKRKDRKGAVYEVGAYHNAMTPERRNENLQIFAKGRPQRRSDENEGRSQKQRQVDHVLICTDRAARGVDFEEAAVDHVVIFDFPKDPAEYVRRVGRTARAGRRGTCTVFAYGWQLPIARQVMQHKSLESNAMTYNELGEKEEDEDVYQFRKNKRTKKRKDALIKESIENGTLWE